MRLLLLVPLLAGCPGLELPAAASPVEALATDPDLDPSCGVVDVLQCGSAVTLNTATDPRARDRRDSYGDLVGRWDGPELGFRFRVPEGDLDLRFLDPRPSDWNLDILVLDGAESCGGELLAWGYNSIQPDLQPGSEVVVVVDGYDGDAGEFTLLAECDATAPSVPAPSDGCSGQGRCVDAFPYRDSDSTAGLGNGFGSYACAPHLDQSGGERVYEVVVDQPGYLAATVDDRWDVDVDLNLLSSLDARDCLMRGDDEVYAHVEPGTYYVVADTYGGPSNAGDYDLVVGFLPAVPGDCSHEPRTFDQLWGGTITTPGTGPVVKEAHLVSDIDGFGASATGPWPTSWTEGIDLHYANMVDVSGMVMRHTEPWAPHNGNNYGQGAHWTKVPPLEEVWYVNMLWADRPEVGTRMILRANGRAVVAAAGLETGPGVHEGYAGATEEIHRYLGTAHRSQIEVGFAADPTLPLGPIRCW